MFWRKIEQAPPSIVNAPGSEAMEKQMQTSAIAPGALHTGAEVSRSSPCPLQRRTNHTGVDSILTINYLNFRVIVVDNASVDETSIRRSADVQHWALNTVDAGPTPS